MGIKFSDKAKEVISVVAPVLGGALGGPLGGLAGHVLGSVLGGGSVEAVEEAVLNQQPEVMLKVRQAELDFKRQLREMDVKEEEIYAKDRDSARDLAKTNMKPHIILSVVFITGYFAVLAMFFVGDMQIDPSLKDSFLVLIGVISASVPTIMAFWFGTSVGSVRKTDLLAKPK